MAGTAMPKTVKIAFHVRKMAPELGILDCSASSIDNLLGAMSDLYPEYKLAPQTKLRQVIAEQLATHVSQTEQLNRENASVAVTSLNQSLINRYHAGTSKRQRPIGSDDSLELTEGGLNTNTVAQSPAAMNDKGDGVRSAKKKMKSKPTKDPSHLVEELEETQKTGRFLSGPPNLRLSDLAGIDSILSQIREMIFFPVLYPHLYGHLGVRPPCGMLLHGPSGCGKTSIALAIAGELGLPFYKATGPELIGGQSGESEERVREIFSAAVDNAPSVLFLDSIDVIASKKDTATRGMDRRVVAQLFDSIDSVSNLSASGDQDGVQPFEVSSSLVGSIAGVEADPRRKLKFVVLIAATNRVDAIDPGVRGRFSRELAIPVPDASSRAKILQVVTKGMRLKDDVNFDVLGTQTPGYVGADLQALAREAGMTAVTRILETYGIDKDRPIAAFPRDFFSPPSGFHTPGGNLSTSASMNVLNANFDQLDANMNEAESTSSLIADAAAANCSISEGMVLDDPVIFEGAAVVTAMESLHKQLTTSSVEGVSDAMDMESAFIEMRDFTQAVKSIQPSAKREGFAVVPDVTWSDVGALVEVREELTHNVLEPIAHPERFRSLGLDVPAGVLFFGPPGCGKTLLAKAIANQSGANFISVKGPELLNMYVGESESRVRQVFSRARASAPCVIFFDELDALCPKRGMTEGGNGVSERVVNQLLTELDGLETRKDVYIIAATNRLELIDDAMLRPGRLGKLLYVPLPTAADRAGILRAVTRKVSVKLAGEGSVDLEAVGNDPRTEGFSGADLAALVREAGLTVVREWQSNLASSPDLNLSALPESMICQRHFDAALRVVKPSVAREDRLRYERVHHNIQNGMGAIQAMKSAGSYSAK